MQAKSFDTLPCLESKLDDLALGQFDAYRREAVDAESIAANHRPLEFDFDQHSVRVKIYKKTIMSQHSGQQLISNMT